jgi:sulfur carrier protein ThiS
LAKYRPKRNALGQFVSKKVIAKKVKTPKRRVKPQSAPKKKKVTGVKKGPPKPEKKPTGPKRRPPKTAKKPKQAARGLHIRLNDVKLGPKQGIRGVMRVADLLRYTAVPASAAIVRLNGKIVTDLSRVKLKTNDVIQIRRRPKPKAGKPTKRGIPEEQKKRTVKKRVSEHVEVPPEMGTPVVVKEEVTKWVDAFEPHWLKSDGSSAVEPSYVRIFPEARRWEQEYKVLEWAYGVDSPEVKVFADMIAEYTQRPIQEVYTLFFSP